jgi:hypothetical protein
MAASAAAVRRTHSRVRCAGSDAERLPDQALKSCVNSAFPIVYHLHVLNFKSTQNCIESENLHLTRANGERLLFPHLLNCPAKNDFPIADHLHLSLLNTARNDAKLQPMISRIHRV